MAENSCSEHIAGQTGTKVVPSIFWVQWVYIRAGDIDASGSLLGSLKGLAIATSLCDSETT